MKAMIFALLLVNVTLAAPKGKNPKDPPSELEGKWIVTEAITLRNAQAHLVDLQFVIKGDEYVSKQADKGNKGHIKTETIGKTKRIHLGILDADEKFVSKVVWIYELDGDKLRMASYTCSNGDCPEKIDPMELRQMVWTLKRVKD